MLRKRVLRAVVGIKRAWPAAATLALALGLAFGCGDKFYAVEDPGSVGEGGVPETGVGGDPEGGVPAGGGASGVAGGDRAGNSGSGGGNGGNGISPGGGSAGAGETAGTGGAAGSTIGGVSPLGGGGSSGGPTDEPVPVLGLELWFDAQVGVTQVDGGVSLWKDRSPFARDANQGTASLRPSLGATALNGKPALVFDGTDDYLDVPTLTGDFSAGVSIFVVGQTDSSDFCMAYFEASNGTETDDVHLGFWEARYLYEVSDPYLSVQMGQVLATPELVAAVHQTSGDVEVRRNGAVLGTKTFALPVLKPREHVFLGKTEYGGCKGLSGRISEFLLYSRSVTVKELAQIEAYLQQKWACCGP
jgi:hypothetical protein